MKINLNLIFYQQVFGLMLKSKTKYNYDQARQLHI